MTLSHLSIVALGLAVLAGCEDETLSIRGCDPTKERMLAEPLACPAGTEVTYDNNGGMGGGFTQDCVRRSVTPGERDVPHGPSTSWNHGRMVRRGQHVEGEEDGTWTYYFQESTVPDGTVRVVQEWDHGKKLRETVYDEKGAVVQDSAKAKGEE